jgi:hypothetical protein
MPERHKAHKKGIGEQKYTLPQRDKNKSARWNQIWGNSSTTKIKKNQNQNQNQKKHQQQDGEARKEIST